jgi:hypothetical protein
MARKLVSIAVAIGLLGIGTLVGSLVSTPQSARAATRVKAYSPDKDTVEEGTNTRPKDDRGDGIGDYFVGYSPLLNKPGGRVIGNEKHQCWSFGGTEDSFSALCNATLWLEGRGKIMVYGSFKAVFTRQGPANVPKFAITGGTGEFRGAQGTVELKFKRFGLTFVANVLD